MLLRSQVLASSGRLARPPTLVSRAGHLAPRRAYAVQAPPASAAAPPPPLPAKPRRSLTMRLLVPLVSATIVFYGVSIPLGFFNLRYRDFIVDSVPFGEQIGDLLDKYELSSTAARKREQSPQPGKAKKETELTRYAESRAKAEGWALKRASEAKPVSQTEMEKTSPTTPTSLASVADAAGKAETKVVDEASSKVQETSTRVQEALALAKAKASEKASQATAAAEQGKEAVVAKLEEAKNTVFPDAAPSVEPKSTLPIYAQRPRELDATPLPPKKANNAPYVGPPLPIGFEPPPGYEVPRPSGGSKGDIKPVPIPPAPLPLVAPAVKDLAASEPIIGQLASTIDSLAKYVANSTDLVSSSASSILNDAQGDIKKLASRLDDIRKAETEKLESQLKKQASEYSGLLLQAEKDLVTRLDTQEEDWKKAFDDERKSLVNAYQVKLEKELETQQEIINQRLKEEVVAQGIEMQRRWVQDIKTRVEQERGGRLAKLEQLEGGIRKLEKVTKENEETLSEAMRARKLFAAVKAIEHKVETGSAFDEELRALQRFVSPSSSTEGQLISTALSSIPESVATTGIASFTALATRFQASVAPQLRRVSLFPEHGGVLAYLSSVVTSSFLFQKEGWAEGDDVVSTIARANFWLQAKDLDLAVREVTTLSGWPKALAKDWLEQARRHLEVMQALEVAEGAATAENLKAV